ncbi:MAG: hypothetical protein HFJ50_06480 [Clostridia bacterium]|jgi:hypothetical protein|nr:hypothetical protein [Clostridia bacterium]
MNIEEIITLAFRKYKLSGKKSMNTFIFTQTKKLSEEDYDKILDTLEIKIKEYEERKKQVLDKQMQEEIQAKLYLVK